MIALDELLRRIGSLDHDELARWIDNRWVLPQSEHGTWLFSEVDVARVELIVEIRREFAVDEEALPLVLGLIDQLYGLRRHLRRLCDALASQPPDIRRAIEEALPRERE
jgi:chaperone modulatory protein CbpM